MLLFHREIIFCSRYSSFSVCNSLSVNITISDIYAIPETKLGHKTQQNVLQIYIHTQKQRFALF